MTPFITGRGPPCTLPETNSSHRKNAGLEGDHFLSGFGQVNSVLVSGRGIEHPNGLRTSEWLKAKIWAICFQLVPDFFSFKDTPGFLGFCSMKKANKHWLLFFQPPTTRNIRKTATFLFQNVYPPLKFNV